MKHLDSEMLMDSPVIAAIKDEAGMSECLTTDCKVIFVLYGNICNIGDIVHRLKEAGKIPIVHMDLITGLSSKEVSVDYIKDTTRADGIITTKPLLVKRAKELELLAIQRFFIIDSIALNNTRRQIETCCPDCVEIMPGVMPKILKIVHDFAGVPVIAGGLLTDKKDVIAALSSGADAVSTTNSSLWRI